MSMEHKAFVFDTKNYMKQLNDLIVDRGANDDIAAIRQFIEEHLDNMKSPYTGEELDENWGEEIEKGDIQEYADFALTGYYAPYEDIGLSYEWDMLLKALKKLDFIEAEYCILGKSIQKENFKIDPGRCGLGLVYAEDIPILYQKLITVKNKLDEINIKKSKIFTEIEEKDLKSVLENLIFIFQSALNDKKGLMLTF
ncbi:hypothetical protein [Clostridium drakei]|uniref:Uncharacterized protein n=1 Tax=Clostridium drakei TaxID=332101 RepID=A0A2U8DMV4_9CLOT|nr:hypothetical protein [Clostridium drakei]AWI03524.1 hypothetical protein B9W14_03180 [Clostridium drakei]